MKLTLILEDVRSAHNVGVILRTAEAAGVEHIVFTGLTPHPHYPGDPRPPYVADRALAQIGKTALGAESIVPWSYESSAAVAITALRHNHYAIAALELAETGTDLFDYQPPDKLALIVGHETAGVSPSVLSAADTILQIPMRGRKESLNVAVATGIAVYQLLGR
jgi:tRNA G18 (ribose-2'-O)-methylase SpoU